MAKVKRIEKDFIIVENDNEILTIDRKCFKYNPKVDDVVDVYRNESSFIVMKNKKLNSDTNSYKTYVDLIYGDKKEFNPGGILSWIFGILFVLWGLIWSLSFNNKLMILFSAAGILFLPPIVKVIYTEERHRITSNKKMLIGLIAILFIPLLINTNSEEANNKINTINTTNTIKNNEQNNSVNNNQSNAINSIDTRNDFNFAQEAKVGDTIKCGDFEIYIKDAYLTNSFIIPMVIPQFEITKTAQENNLYALIKLNIKYLGTETVKYAFKNNTSYFELVGNEFNNYTMEKKYTDYSYDILDDYNTNDERTMYVFAEYPKEKATESLVANLRFEDVKFKIKFK